MQLNDKQKEYAKRMIDGDVFVDLGGYKYYFGELRNTMTFIIEYGNGNKSRLGEAFDCCESWKLLEKPKNDPQAETLYKLYKGMMPLFKDEESGCVRLMCAWVNEAGVCRGYGAEYSKLLKTIEVEPGIYQFTKWIEE